jgi:hypothetical protein
MMNLTMASHVTFDGPVTILVKQLSKSMSFTIVNMDGGLKKITFDDLLEISVVPAGSMTKNTTFVNSILLESLEEVPSNHVAVSSLQNESGEVTQNSEEAKSESDNAGQSETDYSVGLLSDNNQDEESDRDLEDQFAETQEYF